MAQLQLQSTVSSGAMNPLLALDQLDDRMQQLVGGAGEEPVGLPAKVVWQENGEPVDARKIRVRIPNDYWIPRPRNTPRQRRSSWDGSVQGKRPCSVERMLSIVGDRWTFLVLQELFHGNHRFDDFINGL